MYAACTQDMQISRPRDVTASSDTRTSWNPEQTSCTGFSQICVGKLLTFHDEVRRGLVVTSDHLQTGQANMQTRTCKLCLMLDSRLM